MRGSTTARYTVTDDPWGFIVTPGDEDLNFEDEQPTYLEVENKLSNHTLTVVLPANVKQYVNTTTLSIGLGGGPDATGRFTFTGKPPAPFSFFVEVGETGYRARAASDPRATPRP